MTTLVDEYLRAEREVLIEQTYTRYQFLVYLLVTDGVERTQAEQMVREVSDNRPDLDMEEHLTWGQWLDLANFPNDIARWRMASMLARLHVQVVARVQDTPSPGEG